MIQTIILFVFVRSILASLPATMYGTMKVKLLPYHFLYTRGGNEFMCVVFSVQRTEQFTALRIVHRRVTLGFCGLFVEV